MGSIRNGLPLASTTENTCFLVAFRISRLRNPVSYDAIVFNYADFIWAMEVLLTPLR